MYNNQPNYNNQGGGQQHQPNPNGGYLKRSSYSPDGWYGNITITSELLQSIQATGKLSININDAKTNQYGEARRVVAKPYTAPAKAQQGGYNNQAPQPMVQNSNGFQVPQNHPSAANPAQGFQQQPFEDEIPF